MRLKLEHSSGVDSIELLKPVIFILQLLVYELSNFLLALDGVINLEKVLEPVKGFHLGILGFNFLRGKQVSQIQRS